MPLELSDTSTRTPVIRTNSLRATAHGYIYFSFEIATSARVLPFGNSSMIFPVSVVFTTRKSLLRDENSWRTKQASNKPHNVYNTRSDMCMSREDRGYLETGLYEALTKLQKLHLLALQKFIGKNIYTYFRLNTVKMYTK